MFRLFGKPLATVRLGRWRVDKATKEVWQTSDFANCDSCGTCITYGSSHLRKTSPTEEVTQETSHVGDVGDVGDGRREMHAGTRPYSVLIGDENRPSLNPKPNLTQT